MEVAAHRDVHNLAPVCFVALLCDAVVRLAARQVGKVPRLAAAEICPVEVVGICAVQLLCAVCGAVLDEAVVHADEVHPLAAHEVEDLQRRVCHRVALHVGDGGVTEAAAAGVGAERRIVHVVDPPVTEGVQPTLRVHLRVAACARRAGADAVDGDHVVCCIECRVTNPAVAAEELHNIRRHDRLEGAQALVAGQNSAIGAGQIIHSEVEAVEAGERTRAAGKVSAAGEFLGGQHAPQVDFIGPHHHRQLGHVQEGPVHLVQGRAVADEQALGTGVAVLELLPGVNFRVQRKQRGAVGSHRTRRSICDGCPGGGNGGDNGKRSCKGQQLTGVRPAPDAYIDDRGATSEDAYRDMAAATHLRGAQAP